MMDNTSERAFQQLDPLGALIGRPLTLMAAIGIPIYAGVMTLVNWTDVDFPVLAIISLCFVVVACVMLQRNTSPLRAPFTRGSLLVITGTTFLAFVMSAASMWNSNAYIRDDWGPSVVGLALLAMTQYRPAREIAQLGLFSAAVAGVLALFQAHSFVTHVPVVCFAIIAMAPILTLSLASAAFAGHLVTETERWRTRAGRAVAAFREDHSDWIARSVQQDRVTILNQEVVPFFSEVLQRGEIQGKDRERARAISDAIRAVMVAEVDRTWLDGVVEAATGVGLEQLVGGQTTGGHPAVSDPGRLAMQMSTEQRTAVRATIVSLCSNPACDPTDFNISLTRSASRCAVAVEAGLITTNHLVREELAPYFAVMRILFSDLKVRFSENSVELRFSYEQR